MADGAFAICAGNMDGFPWELHILEELADAF
jgi:hypothetical protein